MKTRLDILITERGLAPTRNRARTLIMEGVVFVNGQREDKPGTAFPEDVQIEIKENPIPFVSRGGLKIQKAFDEFDISIEGKVAMDVGASTGGFTDCMLKHGASLVYSVDVGYGQLDYRLRTDDRVKVMERTNVRYLEEGSVDPKPSFVSIDVSFISLKKVIPAVKKLMEPGDIIALIKPQFEAGKELVGKNGVVKDKKVHKDVILEIAEFVKAEGYTIKGLSFSPIKGPKGNIEFLIWLCTFGESDFDTEKEVENIVQAAHSEL